MKTRKVLDKSLNGADKVLGAFKETIFKLKSESNTMKNVSEEAMKEANEQLAVSEHAKMESERVDNIVKNLENLLEGKQND